MIGTHGRSFYVLDGINVLRQLQPEVTTASLHVFTPVPAQRRVQPAAPIDYYLKDAAEKVTIEILDASGKSVRKFESEPPKKEEPKKEEKPAAAARARRGAAAGGAGQPAMAGRGDAGGGGDEGEEEGGGRGGPPARVTTKAGMNRFQWDMRHAPGRDFPGLIMWAAQNRGPMALPGTYQVKVTAGGATQTRPLTIVEGSAHERVRRRSAGAVHARDRDSRQGDGGERDRAAHPSSQGAGQGARREGQEREADGGGRGVPDGADGDRRGDLSVSEPEQSGSAELSDQVE